jgi:cellobiose phosphorylase
MEGRTFAPRCYLGEHGEPHLKFGVNTLCLEAQPFLLLDEDFPLERKRALYAEIRARVLDMEKFGARTREVPIWNPEGRGEDGGIWFSHQGPLIAGVATFDRDEALRLMRNLTFDAYAKHYPDYWVGHWTFADSLESTLSPREGLYAFWLPEAFQPFCAHAHAWMLYCYCLLRRTSE